MNSMIDDAKGGLDMVQLQIMKDKQVRLGLRATIKPLLSRSAPGEFSNSPPKYLRTPRKCPSQGCCPFSPY
eukprot:603574-Prorocentrum_minimum.AAC.1